MFDKLPRHSVNFRWSDLNVLLKAANPVSIREFEQSFANYVGAPFAIAIPSCRFGIFHYMNFLELDSGDEVLLPAFTFSAVPLAAARGGATPVFIDSEKDGFNIDPFQLSKKISKKTRAILVSHLYGVPCDLDAIAALASEHGLALIEDCAHACGSTYRDKPVGVFGDIGIFSFGIGKGLCTVGGGMVVTSNRDVASYFRGIVDTLAAEDRFSQSLAFIAAAMKATLTERYAFSALTYPLIRMLAAININWLDYKMEEPLTLRTLQNEKETVYAFSPAKAQLGLRGLARLGSINQKQRALADYFTQQLPPSMILHSSTLNCSSSVAPYYVLQSSKRDIIRRKLLEQGIDTKACDMSNCVNLFDDVEQLSCPRAQQLKNQLFEIPISPWLTEQDAQRVIRSVNEVSSLFSLS